MRLLIRYTVSLLLLFFLARVALQAQGEDTYVSLPKAILLSRLAENEPLPSRSLDRSTLLKVIGGESERLINGQSGAGYR